MTTMIERVARALWAADKAPWDPVEFDALAPEIQEQAMKVSRAAIAAMRVPTAAMEEAPLQYDAGAIMETPLGTVDARKKYESRRDLRPFIYRAMIDAALEERP